MVIFGKTGKLEKIVNFGILGEMVKNGEKPKNGEKWPKMVFFGKMVIFGFFWENGDF